VRSEPEDEDSDAVVGRAQLTAIDLEEGSPDDGIPSLIISFKVDHFMDRFLKCKHDTGCHGTIQGVKVLADGGTTIENHLLLHDVFCLPLHHPPYIIRLS
jgi:hypothetical protein